MDKQEKKLKRAIVVTLVTGVVLFVLGLCYVSLWSTLLFPAYIVGGPLYILHSAGLLFGKNG